LPFAFRYNEFFIFHIAHNVGGNLAWSVVAGVGANNQPHLSHDRIQGLFHTARVDATAAFGNGENGRNHALNRKTSSEFVGTSEANHLCQILVRFIAVSWAVKAHSYQHLIEVGYRITG